MKSNVKISGKGSGVYLLKSRGKIVYIGMSGFVLGRFFGHKNKVFDEVEIIWKPKRQALSLEMQLIKKYRPKYNTKHIEPLFDAAPQLRISAANEFLLRRFLVEFCLPTESMSKIANLAMAKGLPHIRRLYVQPTKITTKK